MSTDDMDGVRGLQGLLKRLGLIKGTADTVIDYLVHEPAENVLPQVGQHAAGDGNVQVGGDLHVTCDMAPAPAQQAVYIAAVIRQLMETIEPPPRPHPKNLEPYQIDEKLNFNHVRRYRRLIEESSTEFHSVDGAYDALAATSYPSRLVVQRYLRSRYLNIRAETPEATSDVILQTLIAEIKSKVETVRGVPAEWVSPCCDQIVAHAFVECTVLEDPNVG